MATSGTIGQTVIDTDTLLDHALLRCGISPESKTPMIWQTAQQSLYMLLTHLANTNLNLWAVEKLVLGLTSGQGTYTLPPGTIDVLEVMFDTTTAATFTTGTDGVNTTAAITSANPVSRVGVQFSRTISGFGAGTSPISTSYSLDNGATWKSLTQAAYPAAYVFNAGDWVWFDLPTQVPTGGLIKVNTVAANYSTLYLADSVRQIPVTQWSRDTYVEQPNKQMTSGVITNFFYERLVNPQVTFWPVPAVTSSNQVSIWRQRQLQDVGSLTQQLEIPSRQLEAITWQAASRLAFEMPGVDPQRRQEVMQMAATTLAGALGGESDGAPVYIRPATGGYTR